MLPVNRGIIGVSWQKVAVLVSLAFVFLAQSVGQAAPPNKKTPQPVDALPYSRGFLITGGYVAGGVDLTPQANPVDVNGFSTGTIHINSVPPDADIVAAYLYFETITMTSALSQASGATFRGHQILLDDVMAVKKSKVDLAGQTAACFSDGVPLTITEFRVDVLRWLPIRLDKDNKPTGKRLVNDADLLAHGQALHQVKLPNRSGNSVPQSAGASLVLVYRDSTKPLTKVVLYDGIHIQSSLNEVTTQTLQGFYKSSTEKSAQITHIIGSGQPNKNERIFFDDGAITQVSLPDPIAGGSASQRGWSTLTYNVSNLMNPGNNSTGGYGETARTIIDHTAGGGFDCLTNAAVIFSSAVADKDHDGLPDGLEDAVAGLNDPDGQSLPNLNAMGASSSHPDIFVEFNAMHADPGTAYGSPEVPFRVDPKNPANTILTLTDPLGHTHMPTPDMLFQFGKAYLDHGITPHFDVGDLGAYHGLGLVARPDWTWKDDYTSTVADDFLIKPPYASGGETIKEVACSVADPKCQFPKFPGTVGWKFGLELYRDQPVGNDGEEISDYTAWQKGKDHRRRFDRNRLGLFHYVLYAHARGNAVSNFPCLVAGTPTGYPLGQTSCEAGTDNPDFHHPTTASGVADLPGSNVLVTLGLWDGFVGKPFPRASTTFHEIGHNLNLWHGGAEAVWGNAHPLSGPPTSTVVEANCKPNYQSSMSYLFQVIGFFDKHDHLHLDYSDRDFAGSSFSLLNENQALDDLKPETKYQPAWFAPAGTKFAKDQKAQSPGRFCDGTKFGTTLPDPMMARVHSTDPEWTVNWSGGAPLAPDNINFDATADGTQLFSALKGFNDWANLKLDQMGAGRKSVKFQELEFANFGSGDFADFGSGDFLDYGSGDFADFGSGDFADFGSGMFLNLSSGDFADFGSGDFADFGSGDFADFGSGDFLDFGTGELQDIKFEDAQALTPSSPFGLTACVVGTAGCVAPDGLPFNPNHRVRLDFNPPTNGTAVSYEVQRKQVDASNSFAFEPAGTTTTTTFIDPTELPDGVSFTYQVSAIFDTGNSSPWSNPLDPPVVAINDAPTAHDDAFSTNEDTQLADNVLTNDSDDDSNKSGLRVFLVSGPSPQPNGHPSGTLTLDSDGSFTFKPAPDFEGGPVTFTYKVNDGTWTDGTAMSGDSNATVTITSVSSRHTTTTISSNNNPSVYGQAVTFTAIVTPDTTALGTPTGVVTFMDGATTLGTSTLVSGVGSSTATFNTSSLLSPLNAGPHSIVAVYCGDTTTYCDAVFYGSTSAALLQNVKKADATISVTPYNVIYDGNPHTATVASITGVNGETGAAVGTVTLNTTHTGAGTYASDTWSFTGTANYNDVGSTTITDVINKAPSTTAFGAAPAPTYPGGNFTVSASNDSGGAITYSQVSGPCTVVDASAGTFKPTATGSCVVQADSGETANYLAGSAQQTVIISGDASILWVGNDTQSPVNRIARDGTEIGSWGMDRATGSALDGAGHVYTVVPDCGSSVITKYDAEQNVVGTIIFNTGIENGNSCKSWIEDMAYGGNDTLWVSGYNGIMYHIDSTGAILSYFDTGFTYPGIATDGSFLYTTDGFAKSGVGGTGVISKRAFDGSILGAFETGVTTGIGGIGFDASDGTLWVGTFGKILHFSVTGTLIGSFTTTDTEYHDGLEVGSL